MDRVTFSHSRSARVDITHGFSTFEYFDHTGNRIYSRLAICYRSRIAEVLLCSLPMTLPRLQHAPNVEEFDTVHRNCIPRAAEDSESAV